jgi:O-antigen/teichoic acid export membrane protein
MTSNDASPSVRLESILLMGGEALNRASRFLLLLLIARSVGAEEFGSWVIAVSLATLVNGIGDAGMTTVLTREIGGRRINPSTALSLMRKVLPWMFLWDVLFVLAAGLLLHSSSHVWLLLLMSSGAILQVEGAFVLSIHRGQNRLRQEGLARAAEAIVLLGGGAFVFLLLAGSPVAMALVFFLGAVALLITAITQVFVRFRHHDVAARIEPLKPILIAGLPILISNGLYFAYLRADALLLGLIAGREATGLYGAAYGFVFGAAFLPYMFSRGLLARFAGAKPGAQLRRTYAGSAGAVVAFLVAYGVVMYAAQPLFLVLYGSNFDPSLEAYKILIVAFIPAGLSTFNYAFLFARGKAVAAATATATGLAANVGLNLLLIPGLGSTGAAVSLVASEGVVLLLQGAAIWRTLRMPAGINQSSLPSEKQHAAA